MIIGKNPPKAPRIGKNLLRGGGGEFFLGSFEDYWPKTLRIFGPVLEFWGNILGSGGCEKKKGGGTAWGFFVVLHCLFLSEKGAPRYFAFNFAWDEKKTFTGKKKTHLKGGMPGKRVFVGNLVGKTHGVIFLQKVPPGGPPPKQVVCLVNNPPPPANGGIPPPT